MSIITPADFKAENAIAQREQPAVAALIQDFIDKYEPLFLKKLLGIDLYDQFVAGLIPVPVDPPTDPATFEPIDPKWLYLRDETAIKPMLVNYIYYYYLRNQSTLSAGISEVKPKAENARPVSSVDKQVRAWNEMVLAVRPFTLDVSVYPSYERPEFHRYRYWYSGCPVSDIYFTINSLNI